MEKNNKKKMLLAASVAGLLAVTGMMGASNVYAEEVNCSGVNACKGTGACKGAGNECAGKNACKGLGWTKAATAEECTGQGGTVVTE